MACCLFRFVLLVWHVVPCECYVASISGKPFYESFTCPFFSEPNIPSTNDQPYVQPVRSDKDLCVRGTGVTILQGQPKTKVLHVRGTGVTNLQGQPKTKVLHVRGIGVTYLQGQPKTKVLHARGTGVTNLQGQPKTNVLHARGTGFTSVPRLTIDQSPP